MGASQRMSRGFHWLGVYNPKRIIRAVSPSEDKGKGVLLTGYDGDVFGDPHHDTLVEVDNQTRTRNWPRFVTPSGCTPVANKCDFLASIAWRGK